MCCYSCASYCNFIVESALSGEYREPSEVSQMVWVQPDRESNRESGCLYVSEFLRRQGLNFPNNWPNENGKKKNSLDAKDSLLSDGEQEETGDSTIADG